MPDFLCFGAIIVENKAVKTRADEHRAQVINCLKSTGKQLGLLVNFGHYPLYVALTRGAKPLTAASQ